MSKNLLYFKNWAPSGDLLSCLPGIKQVCEDQGKKAVIMQRLNVRPFHYEGAIYSVKDEHGNPVCMSEKQWGMLMPLLQEQHYIHHCEIYSGQYFDYNLDRVREGIYSPTGTGDMYHVQSLIYPELATDLGDTWLDYGNNDDIKKVVADKIIVNLTPRYRNQHITYYFLRDYAEHILFVGTAEEHMAFMAEYGINVPILAVENFLELAQAIRYCRFFLGNQSMCWHIAEGIGMPRMIEICIGFPNVWPHTLGPGLPFTTQENCEKIFRRLYETY